MTSAVARIFFLVFFCPAAFASEWPQWRGPLGDGHVPDGVAVPKTLPSEPKVLWRVKIGDGLASPVVAAGKVFYLDNQVGKETLHAIEIGTGNELWSAAIDDVTKDSQSAAGPRCTPVFSDGRIYSQSCRGELQCRASSDGKQVWRVNYVADFGAVFIGEKGAAQGAARHGYNGSPVIDGDALIALAGGTNGSGVVALNKANGKTLWKSQDDPAAYAPPIVVNLGGRRQIVAFTSAGLIGVDRRDGQLLWRVPLTTTFARHVTTPTVSGDIVMVSSHEFGLTAVRVVPQGASFNAERLWTSQEEAINFSSPVAVEGYLYGIGPQKNLMCVEAATGKLKWSKPGYSAADASKAHASFLVMGHNLLALTDGGQLILSAAEPAGYREISRAQICGRTWCNPAWADGNLYLRDARELMAVRLMP